MVKRRAAAKPRSSSKRTPSKSTRSSKTKLLGRKDEVNAWGEQAFPDVPYAGFFLSGLLILKGDEGNPLETFSPAAGIRAQASTGVNIHVRRPARNVKEAFERLKFVDIREPRQALSAVSARVGMYSAPESLGIASAFFRNEKEHQDLLNEVNDEYDFIPDFPLSLPCRVTMQESPSNRRTANGIVPVEWPEECGVKSAHEMGVRGAGVLVAVLDTGVDADHSEFQGKRITHRYVSFFPNNANWPPRDVRGFDTDGHGTHVSGIIAGRNLGIAPEVSLHVAGVIESETTLTSITRVVAGLQWVMRQFTRPENERLPAVLNMSLGFPPALPGPNSASFSQRLRTMQLILKSMRQANVLPISAIGNEGEKKYGFPGAFPETLGVGAVDFQQQLAYFSGSGPIKELNNLSKPDLVGYGVGVNSSVERDYDNQSIYQRMNGTSMASPYVTAIASLYRSRQPTLTVEETETELKENAISLSYPKSKAGHGLARFV